jgi:hypothetical protein
MTELLSICYSRSELLGSSYAETTRICFSSFGRERIEAVLSRTLEDDDGNSPRKVLESAVGLERSDNTDGRTPVGYGRCHHSSESIWYQSLDILAQGLLITDW